MSADMVTPGSRVADVGCDHAHTDIWLLDRGQAASCIAMDVRKGPLEKARENLDIYGYSDRVELRLSDGLHELGPGEADSIIIAGMGGILTVRILSECLETAHSASELILQPQSHIREVREFLYRNGFLITNEDMCREDGKFYVAMKAVPERKARMDGEIVCVTAAGLTGVQAEFGPVLLAGRHPVLKEYMEIEERKARHRLSQIVKSDSDGAADKKAYFEELCRLAGEGLGLYTQDRQ